MSANETTLNPNTIFRIIREFVQTITSIENIAYFIY